ncbi:hypothetical protein [Candidatus Mycoplasma mahonii]|uniref:hypothetical protein n=1 Tax=Candidatus Mycoplasma mahonii TaxID=3004105 RepID=UPI0026F22603|nr:hypothetical protein [Candidatus Mycoplasma mahonii]WKX02155.1 hypothetical protein O3I44_02005 [Candidatus Mycoplasma mahonii]
MTTREIVLYGMYTSLFLFMGLTPFIGFIPIGPFHISIMLIPVIVMTIHLQAKGAIIAGILFGMVAFLHGIIYGSILIALVGGIWQWIVVSWFSRIIMGFILAIIINLLKKIEDKIYLKAIIIAISALLWNFILFLGFYIPFSGKEFWIVIGSGAINWLIETPIHILAAIAFVPVFKMLNKKMNKKLKWKY